MNDANTIHCEAIVIGGGGAGLRAAIELSKAGVDTIVLSKVFPTRSHTAAAQGGISAPLGNDEEDNWHWHMYDTVKGADWLGDQDAIEFMSRNAIDAVIELEHFGMPFDRLDSGKIYQRPFGGHMSHFGKKPVKRACAVADRTGHAMLHALYQQNVRYNTRFFVEWMALDLILNEDKSGVCGITALEIETGIVYIILAKAVLFATGGAGRIFQASTNAFINTGDGIGMTLRAGLPVQDMEFWQFHPTGLADIGVLITEGVRGEGGYLLNANNERFMERYAPNAKDLASRDVVSRSMQIEINEGRGCGENRDHILLKLDHLGIDVIDKRLPGIREICLQFLGIDPVEKPIPIVPTCHYMMGGIPTNYLAEVIVPLEIEKANDLSMNDKKINGLYAAGECACASVHGANRLGTNSLLDLIVFGKSAGQSMVDFIKNQYNSCELYNMHDFNKDFHAKKILVQSIENKFNNLINKNQSIAANQVEKVSVLRREMQIIMQQHAGVFREQSMLDEGVKKIEQIASRAKNIVIDDKSNVFNTARVEALEFLNLIEVAVATMRCASNRTESRGAHARSDHQERDDENWMKHTMYYKQNSKIIYKPVRTEPISVEYIKPAKRVY